MFEISFIAITTVIYLSVVYMAGRLAERPAFPKKLLDHPLTYTLALGSYAGAWALLGAVGLAQQQGYAFLAYYFGTSALFIFAPLLLQPILNLSRTHRLGSLADLFSFRFNSQWAGSLVTIGTLIAVLPLLAIQITAVEQSILLLTPTDDSGYPPWVAAAFCLTIAVLTIRFGSTHINANARHKGLLITAALQSLLKLTGILIIGVVALVTVFGSPAGLESWLHSQPDQLATLNESLTSNNSRTLMLIFAAAALAMPHMYHMAITESRKTNNLKVASWAFPLYLLLLSLPILPILWAGEAMWAGEAGGLSQPANYFTLLIGLFINMPALSILAYLCILAAATTSMMVILLSVASMCLNHLILPFYPPLKKIDVFSWLQFLRNGLIVSLLLAALLIHTLNNPGLGLEQMAYASYTVAFQFLPGILSVLYWPQGNHKGLIAGLLTGLLLWSVTILLPLLSADTLGLQATLLELFKLEHSNYWVMAAVSCLGFNMLVFGFVSLLTRSSDEERNAAEICSQDDLNIPTRQQLQLHSVPDFIDRLSQEIGTETAVQQVERALQTLSMQNNETRPFALRLLRRQLEANLSGLFGPTVARQIITRQLPYTQNLRHPVRDIQLIEHRLEQYQLPLSGITKELDNLRRYHRSMLEQLPIGVCTLNSDNEILMWNQSLESLTGISAYAVVGSQIASINEPWSKAFLTFAANDDSHLHNLPLQIKGEQRWFTLHKAEQPGNLENKTFLIEETTHLVQLEQELLHNERLASIGRLAAGVAHEIGNPVTGIACLAQNLKYDSDKPEIIAAARDILTQTQRINRIVQSLVNFSHAGSNRRDFTPKAVNVFQCADDAIHLLSLDKKWAAELINNNIEPSLQIMGDTQLLLQVFLNLIKNALDVIDQQQGQITLASSLDDGAVKITVTDNGPGIAEDLQQQIFEPFFTTKEPGVGTGLGLSLVYGIVEEHNGHIHVQSPVNLQTGQGTCFVLRFEQPTE